MKPASYDQMLEAVRRKWKENYSMLSILYNMYSHSSYIIYFHEQWLELNEAVYHILL